jgi:hypothetical protein
MSGNFEDWISKLLKLEDVDYCTKMATSTLEFVLAHHTHKDRISGLIEEVSL